MWEWILSMHFCGCDFQVGHLDADENGLSRWLNTYFKDKRTVKKRHLQGQKKKIHWITKQTPIPDACVEWWALNSVSALRWLAFSNGSQQVAPARKAVFSAAALSPFLGLFITSDVVELGCPRGLHTGKPLSEWKQATCSLIQKMVLLVWDLKGKLLSKTLWIHGYIL